jgi:hypothetical protein
MREFNDGPVSDEVKTLIRTGFFDRTVNKLQAQHPGVDAADAVGTAVLRLITRAPGSDPVEDVAGYLYQAARNAVLDVYDKPYRRNEVEYDPYVVDAAADPTQDHELLKTEAWRALKRLVAGWPTKNMRAYMELWLDACYFGEPLTLKDAARKLTDILGEPVKVQSIGQWKRRGLSKLAEDYQALRQASSEAAARPPR